MTAFRLNRRSCLLSESGNASIPTLDLSSQQTVSTFCQFIFQLPYLVTENIDDGTQYTYKKSK